MRIVREQRGVFKAEGSLSRTGRSSWQDGRLRRKTREDGVGERSIYEQVKQLIDNADPVGNGLFHFVKQKKGPVPVSTSIGDL